MTASNRRILFIQPSLQAVGGIEKVVPTVATELATTGSRVSALVFYGHVPITQSCWSGRYGGNEEETRNLWHKLIKVLKRIRLIRESIQNSGATLIIVSAQGAILIVLAMKLLRLVRIPVIAYIHEARGDGGFLYRVMTGLIYPLADGWIGVSAGICDEIKDIPLVKKNRVVLAYNAVQPAHNIEKASGVMNDLERPVFISAGRFERTKGVDILVDSFLEYADNNPGTLVLLGSGSLEKELRQTVAQRGKESRVRFLGQVAEPRAYMTDADAYVSCARSEPFGLALIEALSVGLPVIATDVPSGPREILSPQVTPTNYPFRAIYGVLMASASRQTPNLKEAVTLLFNTPFDKEVLRNRAEVFSPEAQLRAINHLLDELKV